MTKAQGWAFGLAVLALVAGAAWWNGRQNALREQAVAAQAAIAKAAESRADSLAKVVQAQDEASKRDSAAADSAKAAAGVLRARASALAQDNRTLRQRLTLVGDTAVTIGGMPPVAIPVAVAVQLRSDDSTITALLAAIQADSSALAASERLAAGYKVARDSADAEVASLRQANAALHAQVKLLAPPKCGHVCSGAVGAGIAVLAGIGLRKI